MEQQVLPWARAEGSQAAAILQIHDELLFLCETDFIPQFFPKVKKTMESQVKWSVPIVAEGKFGPSWGDQQKLK